ncbi:MAG: hypothetical protein ABL994_20400 [Verrucomicrobiales bacterium]
MKALDDFTESVRGRVFSMLAKVRGHHSRPVQGSLFPELEAEPAETLSGRDVEALLCLAIVREASEGDWDRVLAQYGRDSERGGFPRTGREVEEAFYLAMFRSCRAEVWMPVVQCYEKLKEDPQPALKAMGRVR